MTLEQLIIDLDIMIKADAGHLVAALENGDRVLAHGFVDSIIDNSRQKEDVERTLNRRSLRQ
jgi:acetyl-CoA carboxylase beta subunit